MKELVEAMQKLQAEVGGEVSVEFTWRGKAYGRQVEIHRVASAACLDRLAAPELEWEFFDAEVRLLAQKAGRDHLIPESELKKTWTRKRGPKAQP